jgi:membrane protein
MFAMLKRSINEFLDDDCASLAAALSYYTIFSLPPLLLLLLLLVGAVMDPEDVRGALEGQLQQLMGPAAGTQVRAIITHAERPGGGLVPTLLGVAALLFGATGAFGQLQSALNRAWEVTPDPKKGGIRSFLVKRLFSFGMVLVIAFLLLVSLVLSAVLVGVGNRMVAFLPAGLSETTLQALNFAISFVVITVLFAMIFQVLPDARVAWRDVWVGSAATALLFVVGKFLIGLYLGKSNPGEAFGAAGSLAIMLLWVYYSSLILLFGAEFTQAWAEQRGSGVTPEPGAVRVEKEIRHIEPDEAGAG